MKISVAVLGALAAVSAVGAETSLVTVNVIVATNTVNDADADAKTALEAAKRAARIDEAGKRSSTVVSEMIADMKSVPGKAYRLGRTEVTAEPIVRISSSD